MSFITASPGFDRPASMRSTVSRLRPTFLESAARSRRRARQTRRKLRAKTTPEVESFGELRAFERDLLRRPLADPFRERLCMIALICGIEKCYIRIAGVTLAARSIPVRLGLLALAR
jgi:hypothetical protein